VGNDKTQYQLRTNEAEKRRDWPLFHGVFDHSRCAFLRSDITVSCSTGNVRRANQRPVPRLCRGQQQTTKSVKSMKDKNNQPPSGSTKHLTQDELDPGRKAEEDHSSPEEFTEKLAEQNKQRFLKLVEALARLRDAQFDDDGAEGIIKVAKKVVALNLPSNLLRAAIIFVDYVCGYPPHGNSFWPPRWVSSKKLLPKNERGSLACSRFQELNELEIGECVVLTHDVPSSHLTAGMVGVIRELPSKDDRGDRFLIEFGEPEESLTIQASVPRSWLRTARPGDMFEHYRS
jgi:hypothetical protein